jgi:hypothetical protein
MTIQELNTELTILLRSYIKLKKYIKTGKLYRSINFNCTERNGGTVEIKLRSEDYILNLENGNLLNNFFNLKKVSELIVEYEVSKIEKVFTS